MPAFLALRFVVAPCCSSVVQRRYSSAEVSSSSRVQSTKSQRPGGRFARPYRASRAERIPARQKKHVQKALAANLSASVICEGGETPYAVVLTLDPAAGAFVLSSGLRQALPALDVPRFFSSLLSSTNSAIPELGLPHPQSCGRGSARSDRRYRGNLAWQGERYRQAKSVGAGARRREARLS